MKAESIVGKMVFGEAIFDPSEMVGAHRRRDGMGGTVILRHGDSDVELDLDASSWHAFLEWAKKNADEAK